MKMLLLAALVAAAFTTPPSSVPDKAKEVVVSLSEVDSSASPVLLETTRRTIAAASTDGAWKSTTTKISGNSYLVDEQGGPSQNLVFPKSTAYVKSCVIRGDVTKIEPGILNEGLAAYAYRQADGVVQVQVNYTKQTEPMGSYTAPNGCSIQLPKTAMFTWEGVLNNSVVENRVKLMNGKDYVIRIEAM